MFISFLPAKSDEATQYLIDGNKFYRDYIVKKNQELLDKAYLNYYKASEKSPSSSSYLGMGMVLMEKKLDSVAKKYLYKAYNIDEQDPATNYYLAKYSEHNKDYLRALNFYTRAYEYGYSNNYDVNYSIASIYEKVGDYEKAKRFYKLAKTLNPDIGDAQERILIIEKLEQNKYKYGNPINADN